MNKNNLIRLVIALVFLVSFGTIVHVIALRQHNQISKRLEPRKDHGTIINCIDSDSAEPEEGKYVNARIKLIHKDGFEEQNHDFCDNDEVSLREFTCKKIDAVQESYFDASLQTIPCLYGCRDGKCRTASKLENKQGLLVWNIEGASVTLRSVSLSDYSLPISYGVSPRIHSFEFQLEIKTASTCVPLSLKRIINEYGTAEAPVDPNTIYTKDVICNHKPNTYVTLPLYFPVDTSDKEFLFSVGDSSSTFFFVRQLNNGDLILERVPQSEDGTK